MHNELPPVKLIECPRDAMQGYKTIFKTDDKIEYLQSLLAVGFDVLDAVSFVSPRAIPQMADSKEVLQALDLSQTRTELLGIVANARGAEDAVKQDKISYLGYPFSISETFQIRNTNKTVEQSVEILKDIQQITREGGKELVVYLSMGFGNPYNEHWSTELVANWVERLSDLGVNIISLSDTVGTANTADITSIFSDAMERHPHIEFGAHLHCKPYEWKEKLEAAYQGGCRRFDGAVRGFGGCPMADDKLTGNMQTESIVSLFKHQLRPDFSFDAFDHSLLGADRLFSV